MVRLRLGRERMETLAQSLKAFVRGANGTQASLNTATIVVSDLSSHNQSIPNPAGLKKKRRRGEKDDDFKLGRDRGRKPRTSESEQDFNKPRRAIRIDYFEDSDPDLSDGP